MLILDDALSLEFEQPAFKDQLICFVDYHNNQIVLM